MPISDKKKCQSLINRVAAEVTTLKASAASLEGLRTKYQDQAVDPTGTPLDGYVPQISTWIDAVRAVADDAVANGFLAHVVPTHRGAALEDE